MALCSLQASAGGIRLLKKNEDASSLLPQQKPANKVKTHADRLFWNSLFLSLRLFMRISHSNWFVNTMYYKIQRRFYLNAARNDSHFISLHK